ncbi:transposon Ty3-I Gag-Pol polyprotein [Nephila pilipes]|uniref:Transposon Ty3-I Gag-Pol polyprotein n=1 Tax=Nephila pilipes TaxID=299642 RepID=A0A8X6QF41_NEPPI|nr:transposon Ty3-I Gag-Pol polyprotein [Nephila pilipes]
MQSTNRIEARLRHLPLRDIRQSPQGAIHVVSSEKEDQRRGSAEFKLSAQGFESLPDRVKCILKFPEPTTQLRHYLDPFNFYRRCIPKFVDILDLVVKLLEGHKNKKKRPRSNARNSIEQLEWNDDANLSFRIPKWRLLIPLI